MRREPALAAGLCLLGAFLVLVATARTWVEVGLAGTAVLPDRTLEVAGAQVAPGVRALGVVALAGVVAIPATRRWGRVVVGLVLLAVGVAVVAQVAGVVGDVFSAAQRAEVVREAGGIRGESPQRTLWPFWAGLGGLVVATAGAFVAVRGRRWASLGRRYEPAAPQLPDAAPAAPERELWEALDRGEDPTAPAPRSSDEGGRLA